ESTDAIRGRPRYRPERRSQQKVHVDLESTRTAIGAGISKSPFAARVLAGYALDLDAHPAAHRLDRLLDLRPLREHRVAADSANVVEVDVDGEARDVEDEQVERRAALERYARLQERVA